ncbi:hypothetical protein D0Y65_006363 [Glycine soja]|uniref:Uncharacterized protein n=1 Tax=Glycine soja TaxID=3848 RepID=A0A445L8V0_GLYSO|nr:hypothetical protein D0Y65_006363 [Glycine soja]RZC19509.1 hypothetical protein D0Y65_006363 [Glycine soja]
MPEILIVEIVLFNALQFDLFFYHFQYVVTSSNNMCFLAKEKRFEMSGGDASMQPMRCGGLEVVVV